jgi:hypothetical protein
MQSYAEFAFYRMRRVRPAFLRVGHYFKNFPDSSIYYKVEAVSPYSVTVAEFGFNGRFIRVFQILYFGLTNDVAPHPVFRRYVHLITPRPNV